MFYSQFILAKKGPLGTIWIAAHLERKLRKNQVNETDITTSVDSILFPEVPIALRLSSHLLLGVVRIYSRKVTYLFQDCNEALQKLQTAFAAAKSTSKSAAIDLPPDAAVAPLHSITLPEELFEFDGLEPAVVFVEDSFDHHVSARDKITLDEPVIEEDQDLHFSREERFASSPFGMEAEDQGFPSATSSAPPELQEDVLPPMDLDAGLADTFPSVEKLRSAPDIPEEELNHEKQDTLEPEPVIEPVIVEPPVPEVNHLVEDEQPIPSTPSTRPEVASPEGVSPDATPALAVADTPLSEKKKGASRKRKELIDEQQTLSESYMKGMLNDASDIRRVRRKVANTPQLIRMFEKEILGKRMFYKPCALQGLCPGLEELYEAAYNPKRQKTSAPAAATVNVTVVPDDQAAPGSPSRAQVPGSPVPVPGTPPAFKTPEQPASPPRPANDQTEEYTPRTPVQDFGTPADLADATPFDQNLEAREPSTAERPGPIPDVENPVPEAEVVPELVVPEVVVPEVVPEVEVNNGPSIESSILGETSSEGSQTSSEGWSSRTRAIAQFLQTTLEQGGGRIAVNGLVRNKNRKEAARMFFETLVLATNDYISVEQSKPYEDVILHARPNLVKAVF